LNTKNIGTADLFIDRIIEQQHRLRREKQAMPPAAV